MKKPNVLSSLLVATVSLAPAFAVGTTAPPTKQQAVAALTGLSVPFEENRGQTDPRVAFQARTLAGPLFVTKTGELVWSLIPGTNTPGVTLVERFSGQPQPVGAIQSSTRVNYLLGNDPTKWQRNVPTWEQVSLGQVWPGISVSLAARGKNAEKIFTLAPGADVNAITVAVTGSSLQLEADGGLRVAKAEQQPLVSFSAPVAWQEINGQRQPVTVAYRLAGESKYGFTLGQYDAKYAVVIDPVLQSTFLGGTLADNAYAIGASTFGIYVAGSTASTDFPSAANGYVGTNTGTDTDAFVARLATDLKSITQVTYLGGNGDDVAKAIVVAADSVYVAGWTAPAASDPTDFPGVATATATDFVVGAADGLQKTRGGLKDAFVTRLAFELTAISPTDLQSTYLGGTTDDVANALAVTTNAVYVAGTTGGSFPFVNATAPAGVATGIQSVYGGADATKTDAFIAKIPLDLIKKFNTADPPVEVPVAQATYFGGTGTDTANAIAVTTAAVYIAGSTDATIPFTGSATTVTTDDGARKDSGGGTTDAYVARVGLDLTSNTTIKQATYLGGNGADVANALAVGTTVYVAGSTTSPSNNATPANNFPFVANGMQATYGGGTNGDAFVTRLGIDLKTSTTQQSTYLGGASDDVANALVLTTNALYVVGTTTDDATTDLPVLTTGAAQPVPAGSTDAFAARLGLDLKTANTIKQATFLGGAAADTGNAVAILATDSTVYVAGNTTSIATVTTTNFADDPATTTVTETNSVSGIVPATNPTVSVTVGFPSTASGADIVNVANGDAFVTRFSADLRAGVPIAVTGNATNLASPAASAGATLAGTVTPNGSQTTASFDIGTTTTYSTNIVATAPTNGIVVAMADPTPVVLSLNTANYDGLDCGVLYHYRVKATSTIGTSNGLDKTFTLPCTPTVTTVAESSVGVQEATLNGTINAQGSQVLTVSFVFGNESVTYTGTSPNDVTLPGTNPNANTNTAANGYYDVTNAATPATVTGTSNMDVTAVKTGLSCGGTYYYRVKAITGSTAYYGREESFTTGACTVPVVTTEAPTGILAKAVTALVGKVNYGGATAKVQFQFSPTGVYTDAVGTTAATYQVIDATPATITTPGIVTVTAPKNDLTCYTRYHYRVKATNSVGTSYGNDMLFNTQGCAPTVTTDPATFVSVLQANLNSKVNGNGASTTVVFDLGTAPAVYTTVNIPAGNVTGENVVPQILVIPGSTTGLYTPYVTRTTSISCGKTYYYRARASNAYGTTNGVGVNFVTPPCAPVVATLAATEVVPTDANLRGTVNPKGLATSVSFDFGPTTAYGYVVPVEETVGTPATIVSPFASAIITAGNNAGHVLPFVTIPVINLKGAILSSKLQGGATDGADSGSNADNVSKADANGLPITGTVLPIDCGATYNYRLRAKNTAPGATTATTALGSNFAVLTKPCAPTATAEAPADTATVKTNITPTSAVLKGVVDANGAATTVFFELGLTPSSGNVAYGTPFAATPGSVTGTGTLNATTNATTGTTIVSTKTGLTCGTGYSFRVKAVNTGVDGVVNTVYSDKDTTNATPGDPETFTTEACNPAVTTESASAIITVPADPVPTAATAVLNGTVIANGATLDGNNGNWKVSFDFGPTQTYGTSVDTTTTLTTGNGNTKIPVTTAAVTGLLCGSKVYNYRIRANKVGSSPLVAVLGANKTLTTLPCTSAPNATTTDATFISASRARLNGKVKSNGSDTTVTFDFGATVNYGTSIASETTSGIVAGGTTGETDVTAVKSSGLACGVTYNYRVKAVNSDGTTLGANKTFTTICAPVVTTEQTAANVTATTATIKGTVNAKGSDATVTFDFKADTTFADANAAGATNAIPGTVSGITAVPVYADKSSLTCGHTYFYRTRAVNNNVTADSAGASATLTGTTVGATKSFTTVCAPTPSTTQAGSGDLVYNATTGAVTAKLIGAVTTGTNGAATASFDFGTTTSYGTSIVPTTGATIAASQTGAAVTKTELTGLACGVTYHYRTRAKNAGGNVVTDTKSIYVTCPPGPTTIDATALGLNAATLNGKLVDANKTTAATVSTATTTSSFEYALSSQVGATTPTYSAVSVAGSAATTSGGSTDGKTANAAVTAVLAGSGTTPALTCGTNYYYRLKSVNDAGTRYGAEKSFRTSACTHTAVTAAASGVGATAATLKGVVNAKGLSGVTAKFDIGLASNAAGTYSGVTGGTDITATTPTSGAITGSVDTTASVAAPTLAACTEYRYRVKAVATATNSKGTINGADVVFSTPCPTAATVAAGSITANGATLNGSVNANGASGVAAKFDWGTAVTVSSGVATYTGGASSVAATESVTNASTTPTSVSKALTGLTCNTTYHYRVKAVLTTPSMTFNGSDAVFTTGPCVVTSAAGATAPSLGKVTIKGTVNAGGVDTTASFESGATDSYGTNTTATTVNGAASSTGIVLGTTTGAINVSADVTCNAGMHYRVKGVNANGTAVGSDTTVTTCP